MKIKHKKVAASGIAIALVGVLGVGALLQTSVSVQASSAMMPGIEEIVKNASSDATPFRILEIVDDYSEAEIGYYISGQEPYIKLYKDKDGNICSFTSLDDGLSKLTDSQTRKEFAENKKTDEDGNAVSTEIKDISYAVGDNAPLSYSDYQERYFTNPDNWKEIEFKNSDGSIRTEKVDVQGQYQQNPNGTGDYTKQEQTYYPIRQDPGDKSNELQKFRENIQNFFFSEGDGANAPYYLEFEQISNETLNQMLSTTEGQAELQKEYDYSKNRFGYYENIYSNLTTDLAEDLTLFPGENPEVPAGAVPLMTISPLRVEDQFSVGEDEFGTGGVVTNDTTASDNAFSDDGTAIDYTTGDEFSDSQQISDSTDSTAVPEDTVPVEQQPTAEPEDNADAALDDGTQGEMPTTLKKTSEDAAVGTAADPYVYLGTTIQEYPYYSYTIVTDLKAAKDEADYNEKKKQEAEAKGETYVPGNQAITVEDGQYYYWQQSGNDMVKSPITIITGKQPVSYSDLIANKVSDKISYNYYYRVSAVYFCCKPKADNTDTTDPENYEYYGWYYSTHPQNEDVYIPVTDGETPTYYISDAEYKLTPGTGDYDFVPGDGDGTKNYKVETDHMYYTGGYTNNDWFKKYVFHLDADDQSKDSDFNKFNIEVDTLTAEEFTERYGNETSVNAAADTEENTEFADSEVTEDTTEEISSDTSSNSDQTPEADTENEDGQESEVASIVSEAGVELVSIEKELSDNNADSEINTESESAEEAGTEAETSEEPVAEDLPSESSEESTQQDQTSEFQDGSEALTDAADFTEPQAEFTDDTENLDSTFSAGDTADDASASALSEYNLIYLNGTLETSVAKVMEGAVVTSSIPCIVNAVKVKGDLDFEQKYGQFIQTDADDHYVKNHIYFFKNTLEPEGSEDHTGDLINLHFNENFNPDLTDGTSTVEGFEEILKYIEKENQYRQIGSTDDNASKVSLLTTELSQARAIEYIINYKFKRQVTYKDNINVLEIMTDGNCSESITKDVYSWMGEQSSATTGKNVKIASVTACDWHIRDGGTIDKKEPGNPEKMIDGDTSTIWHSLWEGEKDENGKVTNWDGTAEHHNGAGHYITITLEQSSDVSGFVYTPRQDGSKNGVLKTYSAEFYDIYGNPIDDSNISRVDIGTTESNYKDTKTISFGKTIHDVKTIKLYFNETLAHQDRNNNKFATCAELSIYAEPEVTWPEITQIEACHSQSGQGPENMLDSDLYKYWHSPWYDEENKKNNWDGRVGHNGKGHYITITLNEASEVNGFWYQSRRDQGGDSVNGVLTQYEAEFYDENDKLLDTASGLTGLNSSNFTTPIEVLFGKTVSNVKYMKLYFSGTLATDSSNNNAFATCGQIKLFNISNKYSISATSSTASEFVGHTDDICAKYDMIYIGDYVNEKNRNSYMTGSKPYCYVHVGDGKIVTSKDIRLFKLLGQLDTEYESKTYDGGKRRFAPFSTYGENSGGYFRGSGNDMTKQNYEELMEFVKSGYPVVLGNNLVTGTGENKAANPKTVDTSSYYYQFIQDALKYSNVMTKEELDSGEKDLMFWANLSKPVIKFTDGGKPAEPPRAGESGSSGSYINGELKFTFTISNDSEVSPATATYDCNLYIDLNFDGNFSDKEVQDKYIQITDETGTVLSTIGYGTDDSRYELKAGKTYTLTRKIPADYFKLITWKLEVSNNTNSYIHTCETGYSKQKNKDGENAKQEINVLQLAPDERCKWTLESDTNFWTLVDKIEDFKIIMTTKTVSEFNEMNQEQVKELLKTQQMLIIGFADSYPNLDNSKGQVDEILSFIKQGKSVLFSHDTTSYLNFDYTQMYGTIAASEDGSGEETSIYDGEKGEYENLAGINNVKWGYSLNKVLRTVVGMDRYGITSDEAFGKDGKPLSELMKQGKALSNSEVSFEELMKVAGDIAYQQGSNRTKSYGQTQAYTNNLLTGRILGSYETEKAVKVNDGAITQYPYKIPETLNVAKTHGQWYQLALERDRDLSGKSDGKTDVVVWYCLADSIYSDSPNDVRNNYYFYSNKNVIYTGAGHSYISGSGDDFERKLFINAMVAAANVTAVQPEVNFVKSLDPAAKTESTKYYMTDQTTWNNGEANTLEKDMNLYFNVKDYNMVSADLNPEDLKKQEMTVQIYIEDPSGEELTGDGIPEELKGKRVTDLTGVISGLRAYGDEDKLITVGNEEKNDNKFHLTQNNAYGFSISEIEKYLRDDQSNGEYYENCKVYIVVNSTVYLYGQENSQSSWASIDLKQRQLFDLD